MSVRSTWLFRFAPVIAFVMPLFVVLLVPALTTFPLTFAFMGDMVAAGFFLALAGFFTALAAMDTAIPTDRSARAAVAWSGSWPSPSS